MSNESAPPEIGAIAWRDLTVENAGAVREFYEQVVGWEAVGVSMGDYEDYAMLPPGAAGDESRCVAGICHARGSNADLPPQWLIYITVEDVNESAETCRKLGGEVLVEPRSMGGGRFAVIRDPAGAVCALWRGDS